MSEDKYEPKTIDTIENEIYTMTYFSNTTQEKSLPCLSNSNEELHISVVVNAETIVPSGHAEVTNMSHPHVTVEQTKMEDNSLLHSTIEGESDMAKLIVKVGKEMPAVCCERESDEKITAQNSLYDTAGGDNQQLDKGVLSRNKMDNELISSWTTSNWPPSLEANSDWNTAMKPPYVEKASAHIPGCTPPLWARPTTDVKSKRTKGKSPQYRAQKRPHVQGGVVSASNAAAEFKQTSRQSECHLSDTRKTSRATAATMQEDTQQCSADQLVDNSKSRRKHNENGSTFNVSDTSHSTPDKEQYRVCAEGLEREKTRVGDTVMIVPHDKREDEGVLIQNASPPYQICVPASELKTLQQKRLSISMIDLKVKETQSSVNRYGCMLESSSVQNSPEHYPQIHASNSLNFDRIFIQNLAKSQKTGSRHHFDNSSHELDVYHKAEGMSKNSRTSVVKRAANTSECDAYEEIDIHAYEEIPEILSHKRKKRVYREEWKLSSPPSKQQCRNEESLHSNDAKEKENAVTTEESKVKSPQSQKVQNSQSTSKTKASRSSRNVRLIEVPPVRIKRRDISLPVPISTGQERPSVKISTVSKSKDELCQQKKRRPPPPVPVLGDKNKTFPALKDSDTFSTKKMEILTHSNSAFVKGAEASLQQCDPKPTSLRTVQKEEKKSKKDSDKMRHHRRQPLKVKFGSQSDLHLDKQEPIKRKFQCRSVSVDHLLEESDEIDGGYMPLIASNKNLMESDYEEMRY